MSPASLLKPLFFIFFALCSAGSFGQDIKAAQAQLTSSQQQLEALLAQQQSLQTTISQNEVALAPLLKARSPEQLSLEEARIELEQAKLSQQAGPSDSNQAKLKNAEFKYALAERKFKKANAQQFELQETNNKLGQQLQTINSDINKLRQSIAVQTKQLGQSQQAAAEAERARAEEAQRQKVLAAEREIARLKAKLAEQEEREKARKAAELAAAEAAKKADAEARAQASSAANDTSQTASTAEAPSKAPAAALTTATPSAAPQATKALIPDNASSESATTNTETSLTNTSAEHKGIRFLDSAQAIQAEQLRLEALLAQPEEVASSRYNKILNVKPIDASKKTVAHSLRPLGHNIYEGNAEIEGGEALFSVGFYRWQTTVAEQATIEYRVIYDGSDPQTPQLIYYPKSLAP